MKLSIRFVCISFSSILAASILLGVFWGCKPNKDILTPNSQSINEPSATDPNRNYRILSVTLPGIPFENIKIDQRNRLIRVTIPTDYSGGELKPVVTLTENTTLVDGLGQRHPFRMESFCYCNAEAQASIGPVGITPSQTPIQYRIIAQASAPLELKLLQAPLVVPIGEFLPFSLPVQNPYGNSPILKAYVQRVDGGSPILIQGTENNPNSCAWFGCDYKQLSTLSFTVGLSRSLTLEPGNYQLTLEQQNGRRLTLSQPLQLVRGETRLSDYAHFGYTVTKGQATILIRGYNLYKEEITGIITTQNGQSLPIRAIAAAPNSTTLSMAIPSDLPLGYHQLLLARNGVTFAECLRLSVRQSDKHPVIYSLVNGTNCLANSPVTIQRGVRRSVIVSYFNSSSTLKLTSTTQPNESYQVAIVLPIESFPQITLPQTIPAGTYRVTLLTEDKGQLYESEPFEQPIIVQ